MHSWLLLAEAAAPKGGLFDLDATLPLMAVQVVLLTFILNALFFRPVGKAVEDREGFISTSRAQAKEKLAQAERLEAELKAQLLDARKQSLAVIQEAEEEVDRLFREALALAQSEANAVREKARVQVDAQKAEAFAGIDAQAEKLGSLIVDRLLAA
ncbi:MAG: F0F1 ATP synthase subunit B' [Synechococcus sp. MED-G71]|jgi:F-type H+-transporting ATPase subunit b|nr:MAG: F0F1 ATP synthase subunit B' [Synechococcus sp. MED-G71]|tara:strand:+ start:6350 stop:6817 length:468 start_codon:yes stop_codon:yes gene_type:complete